MHEAQSYKQNSFITLTYDDKHLPADYSIHKDELQRFFKRLRKNTDVKLRYFACGEYGEKNMRPHYHAIIFGYDFPDKVLHTKTKRGDLLYRSQLLEKTWTYGFSLIGDVSFQSAAYVSRYVMKKRKGDDDYVDPKTGKTNKEHYMVAHPETGEVHQLEPEFCLMSRRPGLGRDWLEKYKSDTNKDFITMNGAKFGLPKYYDNILAAEDELDMMNRKMQRKKKINKEDRTMERLHVIDTVKKAQTKSLTRDLEQL